MKITIGKGQIMIESSLGTLVGHDTLLLSHIATILVSAGTNRKEVVTNDKRTIEFDYEVENRIAHLKAKLGMTK